MAKFKCINPFIDSNGNKYRFSDEIYNSEYDDLLYDEKQNFRKIEEDSIIDTIADAVVVGSILSDLFSGDDSSSSSNDSSSDSFGGFGGGDFGGGGAGGEW